MENAVDIEEDAGHLRILPETTGTGRTVRQTAARASACGRATVCL
jgi:hypothetical protein